MPFYLNTSLQRSIIILWYLAWMLITAMPVIHANTSTLSSPAHHCPVASMTMFDEQHQHEQPLTTGSQHTKVYQCPLCHCAYLIFDRDIAIALSQVFSVVNYVNPPQISHLLITLFKPARSPPY